MDAREQWQTLQGLLTKARALADVGDRADAIQHVERALQIDPDFLAAHSLKDRLAESAPADRAPGSAPPSNTDAPSPARGLSAMEAKVLARRAERRLQTASDAIARRDFALAAAALDEARELGADPGHVLSIERVLAEARRERRRPAVTGRRVVLAATVLIGVLGTRYAGDRLSDDARPDAVPATAAGAAGEPVGTAGVARPTSEFIKLQPDTPRTPADAAPAVGSGREEPRHISAPPPDSIADTAASAPPHVAPPPMPMATPIAPIAPPAPVEPAARMPAPAASAADLSIGSLPATQQVVPPRIVEDESGVRDALQRYRVAYEQLNAESARAVWPAVDERALARAFDNLASQQLQFDACDVNVRGEAASATCRGTATYTPKVGSGDARIEPRTWSFTLRKGSGRWAIETARVGR